ncbi:MAG: hypothetical protein L0210_05050 [Rhodospirillales bacterium]|nr:hypothetical protein [Rhodospirillales bacterium]
MIQQSLPPRPPASSDARPNRGRLNNGNPPGDYMKAPRCGAKTRASGCACRQPAMANGRCRFHGGKSTGARTAEGRARCARARRTHGFYSAETVALRREARTAIRRNRDLLAALRDRPAGHGVLSSKPRSDVGAAPCGRPLAPSRGRPHGGAPTVDAAIHRRSSVVAQQSSAAGHGVLPSIFRCVLNRAASWLALRPHS